MTTVPQQQLFVLNSEFIVEPRQGVRGAGREGRPRPTRSASPRRYGWPSAACRRPANGNSASTFLRPDGPNAEKLTPWQQYAQALLATNEFNWVD